MTAPKLTESQREALERCYTCGSPPFSHREWLLRTRLAYVDRDYGYQLTAAGRAALRGES